jgi:hypothetical protein
MIIEAIIELRPGLFVPWLFGAKLDQSRMRKRFKIHKHQRQTESANLINRHGASVPHKFVFAMPIKLSALVGVDIPSTGLEKTKRLRHGREYILYSQHA